MIKFGALLKRGGAIHLVTSEQEQMGGVAPPDAGGMKALLAPAMPFLRWWMKEMKGMLPKSMRRLFSERRLMVRASHKEVCIADPEDRGGSSCHPIKGGEEAGILLSGRTARRCDVVLDESLVLERELELPIDAEATLRRVLSFSMDRYTPFNEHDVLFDYQVLRRDSVTRKIAIVLYVVPREGIAPIMHRLATLGLEPACLDIESDQASGRAGINLLATEKRLTPSGVGRGTRLMALSAFVLLLVTLVLPFVLRQQAVSRLEAEFNQLSEQARQAETGRMELLDRVERMRLIQSRSMATPAMLDVLLELTRVIPDDAWAGQVTIKSGRVRLNGEANAASELLTRLSNSAIFSDPKFEAPLTQNPRTGRERFVISLAIRSPIDEP